MNHAIILPVALPAIVAALTVLGMRHTLLVARTFSLLSTGSLILVATWLVYSASDGAIQGYALGNWAAPFGIVLVLDRLSAMMLLLAALLAFLVLVHVIVTGFDRRGWHFHPLFQFQLLGLNGAFLTGDLFNLFVFFEVLLIASYGLMLHGQGKARLRAGVQYVVINLVGSTLFLVALGILYGMTGTLNMADMGARIAAAPAADQGLIRAGGLILMTVFGLKAALLPLHLWLPGTYSNTSAPVAALFAIMTKVGVYSIIRVATLVFGAEAGAAAWVPSPWFLPAALLSVAIGFVGLFAAKRMREMAAFIIIGSTGTLLVSVSLFEPRAMAAGLYYLPHTTLAGAALFLICDLLARRRPDFDDTLAPGPAFPDRQRLAALFLLAAIALVGLPPLSGFIGKLLILEAARDHQAAPWIWAVLLSTTFLGILAFARAGSSVFWKTVPAREPRPGAPQLRRIALFPVAGLLALLVALTVAAGPVTAYARAATDQLFDPAAYRQAVLGRTGAEAQR